MQSHYPNTAIGAVDLDIYGALQLCAIGVLTAPASVRLSNTYFNSEGRSIIFVWSMLVLAGKYANSHPRDAEGPQD
jgi:hypothetical protein